MKSPLMRYSGRSGIVLIIIVGIAGLLASLALAFLAKVNQGEAITAQTMRDSQARIMLHAACSYILEAGRMGYDNDAWVSSPLLNTTHQHREAFGWVDVRDGSIGPRDQVVSLDSTGRPLQGQPVYIAGRWPDVGGVVIQPMHRLALPPYAIRLATTYNPILANDDQRSDPNWGRPYLIHPDPQPVIDNGYRISADSSLNDTYLSSVSADNWSAFKTGNPIPVADSLGLAWFRVARLSPSRFVVTCGAGGTMGFKDWGEVTAPPSNLTLDSSLQGDRIALFGNEALFNALLAAETRTWYEVQWSAGVLPQTKNLYPQNTMVNSGAMQSSEFFSPLNGSITRNSGCTVGRYSPTPLGSITYIQRLDGPPTGMHPDMPSAKWIW